MWQEINLRLLKEESRQQKQSRTRNKIHHAARKRIQGHFLQAPVQSPQNRMLKVEDHKIQDPAEYSKHLASKTVLFPASFS
jgi:hypothetical protein